MKRLFYLLVIILTIPTIVHAAPCYYKIAGYNVALNLYQSSGSVVYENANVIIKTELTSADFYNHDNSLVCPKVYYNKSVLGSDVTVYTIVEASARNENSYPAQASGSNVNQTIVEETGEFPFCQQPGVLKTFRLINYLMFFIKIIVPLILIVFGVIEFAKAVISGDDKAPGVAIRNLVIKCSAGIIIFFLPTIFNFVTHIIVDWTNIETQFGNCQTCLFNSDECNNIIVTYGGEE